VTIGCAGEQQPVVDQVELETQANSPANAQSNDQTAEALKQKLATALDNIDNYRTVTPEQALQDYVILVRTATALKERDVKLGEEYDQADNLYDASRNKLSVAYETFEQAKAAFANSEGDAMVAFQAVQTAKADYDLVVTEVKAARKEADAKRKAFMEARDARFDAQSLKSIALDRFKKAVQASLNVEGYSEAVGKAQRQLEHNFVQSLVKNNKTSEELAKALAAYEEAYVAMEKIAAEFVAVSASGPSGKEFLDKQEEYHQKFQQLADGKLHDPAEYELLRKLGKEYQAIKNADREITAKQVEISNRSEKANETLVNAFEAVILLTSH
jgi:hypothetical protein